MWGTDPPIILVLCPLGGLVICKMATLEIFLLILLSDVLLSTGDPSWEETYQWQKSFKPLTMVLLWQAKVKRFDLWNPLKKMKIMATFNTFFFDIRDLLQDSWTQNAFDFLKGDQAQNDLGFMVDQAKWVCKIGYLLSRKIEKNLYFTKTNFLWVAQCLKITQNVSFIFYFCIFHEFLSN